MPNNMSNIRPGSEEVQLLYSTDWANEWLTLQKSRNYVDMPEKWDKRAPSFGQALKPSPYVDAFIRLIQPQAGDVFFDMGCGNGTLAIPLAQAGHEVWACDFSRGMLSVLADNSKESQVEGLIHSECMSWSDDWKAHGIVDKSVDVAFASRSVINQDLGECLLKLSRVARRKAAVSVSTGFTPSVSPSIIAELGMTPPPAYDYLYTVNILVQKGFYPEISYIRQDRCVSFDSQEDGQRILEEMLERCADFSSSEQVEAARAAIPAWLLEHTQANERAGQLNRHSEVEGRYKFVLPGDIRWAYIQWEV